MDENLINLDQNLLAMAEKTRYSDEELQEFKELILEKLDKAKKDYDLLKGVISGSDGNDGKAVGVRNIPAGVSVYYQVHYTAAKLRVSVGAF